MLENHLENFNKLIYINLTIYYFKNIKKLNYFKKLIIIIK